MKSQLIYTFPLPISGFFIVQTRRLHSICSQLTYNILGPLAVGSCWVSFRFVLGSLESSWAWASTWTGAVDEAVDVAVAVVMPFWHLITIWLLWAKWMCPQCSLPSCLLLLTGDSPTSTLNFIAVQPIPIPIPPSSIVPCFYSTLGEGQRIVAHLVCWVERVVGSAIW